MRYSTRIHRILAAAVAAAAMAAAPAALAHAEPSGPDVPAKIAVEDGHKVFLVAHATGVQIYSCNATAGGHQWGFVAPRATMYADNGQVVGTHFSGPTWEAKDGSRVVAQRVDGVTVDPTAIPWLLLSKVSTTAGADGSRLTATTFIQRTATTGGLAPAASECGAATVGEIAEVPYTADYAFWKATGS